jgi:hypothetical protein
MNYLSEILVEIQDKITSLKNERDDDNMFINTYVNGQIDGLEKALEIIEKFN